MCNSFKNFESCCFNFENRDFGKQKKDCCGNWDNFSCFDRREDFGRKDSCDFNQGFGFDDWSRRQCQDFGCHNQRPCQCRPCNKKKCCIEINWRCF